MGLNFTIDMTWGRLILLSLIKKRPKNQSPDTWGAGKWWFNQCTVAPAAFWKCAFFWRPCIFTWIFKAPFQDQGPHKLLPPGHCLQSRICKQRHLSRIFTRGSQLCRIFARRASQLWNQGFSARFFLGLFKQYLGLLQYFVIPMPTKGYDIGQFHCYRQQMMILMTKIMMIVMMMIAHGLDLWQLFRCWAVQVSHVDQLSDRHLYYEDDDNYDEWINEWMKW